MTDENDDGDDDDDDDDERQNYECHPNILYMR